MKKLFFTLILPVALLAKSFLISDIPLPKTYVQNLDPYPCDEDCLQEYIDNEMVFSFLAHAQTKLEDEEQNEFRTMNIAMFNLGFTVINKKLKIALLLPYKKIGKYASSTTNASFAYLITRNKPFELKSYKVESESKEDIQKALDEIEDDGFIYVIAPVTSVGEQIISDIDPEINIFIPTVNKKDSSSDSESIYHGGIDYKAQSDILLEKAVPPLVIFHDKSAIGEKLALYEEGKFNYRTINYAIDKKVTNLEGYLKKNESIQNGSCFINTPIIKTSMIMSQLTLYDTNPKNILSTQINYDPLILSMTQYSDRKNMIIANSITKHNNILTETNSLLNNDIEFDWINYTTTVGIDYFFNMGTNEDREYDITIVDNQMVYPIELVKPSVSKFFQYK